ncbi:queuine tRNA-ribosyltransferase accessory subunit 2 isoform X1 [Megachile rotundata]|uniref:queuine tRNA-ribosyltransferase accessory subunit 2 isoform X1 n=1 Tax=Megachile rotundata TaxID=143995 RepID=UPI003FD24353
MKFNSHSAKSCSARIGTLSEFQRNPDLTFETPLALVYTKGGSVPHLTKDVFQMITTDPQLLSVSLTSTLSMLESIKYCNVNFAEFVGMKEYLNFLTFHDPCYAIPSGYHQTDFIPLWTRNGKYMLTPNKYMDIIEAFKPDMYVALHDGDTNVNSSKKRVSKAVQRTGTFFEQCLARHLASDALKSSEILGAIEGGYDIEARTLSINLLKDKPVIGYIIDGLHNNGPDVRNISTDQIKQVVAHTANLLPPEKLKVSTGCWNPLVVLDLVELGVDIFDTSYPYIATENSEALTFLCDHNVCNNIECVISFTEDRYREDFSPICSQCECLACKNHTRAYLHHLCHTREMLSMVLLMIHNVHQYLEFFKLIRESIKNDTLQQFRKKINLKYKQANNS